MTTTSTAVKSNCMTKLQKTIITAALAVSTSFVIYEVRQAAQLKQEYQMVKNNPSEYLQELQRERDDASNRVAWLTDELDRGKSSNLELLRLRGEIGMLRQQLEFQKTQTGTKPSKTVNASPIKFLSKDQVINAGFATPEAALQTRMHAQLSGDFDLFLSSYCARCLNPKPPPPEKALKFQEEWKKESQEAASRFQGQQILAKQVINEDKIDLYVLFFETGKFPRAVVQQMEKEGNRWKIRGFARDRQNDVLTDAPDGTEIYTPSANQ